MENGDAGESGELAAPVSCCNAAKTILELKGFAVVRPAAGMEPPARQKRHRMAASSWGNPISITLAHDPVLPRSVESVSEAVALLEDPYWGDVFSIAYAEALRALCAARTGSGTVERARWLFLQAADAAGNSASISQRIRRTIGQAPPGMIAAE